MSSAFDAMTPAQREARSKAIELLTEHFDGFVLIVRAEADEEQLQSDYWLGAYEGGRSSSLGLMQQYTATLLPVRTEFD